MKALVGAFNQEKALVGAFSMIVQPVVEPMDRFTALIRMLPSGGDNPALVLGDLLTVRSFSLLNSVIIVMFYSRWA